MYKNLSGQKFPIYAHDMIDDTGKTGDAANITAQISKNGGACAATNDVNPTEIDATDQPGMYLFTLTQAETNADLITLVAVSSTSDVSIDPEVRETIPNTTRTLGSNSAVFVSPVDSEQNIEIHKGDDYTGDRKLTWTITSYSGYDLSGASGTFRMQLGVDFDADDENADVDKAVASISVADSTVTITVELAAADTASLVTYPPRGEANYYYQIRITTSESKLALLIEGEATVKKVIGAAS